MVIVLSLLSSCSQFSGGGSSSSSVEDQKVFATHMRSLCSTVENFNDLLKKAPDSMAWAGYGIIINDKINIFQKACADDPLMGNELKQQFSEVLELIVPFTSASIEKKKEAQTKLMGISRVWLKKYQL